MSHQAAKGLFAGAVAFGAAAFFLGLSPHLDATDVYAAAAAIALGVGATVGMGGLGKP